MRLNTVAVLYNDALDQIAKEYPGLAAAMSDFGRRTAGWESDGHFHTGRIVSMDDADVRQVVVVDHNDGERVTETSASPEALKVLAVLLSCHGYNVTRPPEPSPGDVRPAPAEPERERPKSSTQAADRLVHH